jgi:uncharacterized membrane protein
LTGEKPAVVGLVLIVVGLVLIVAGLVLIVVVAVESEVEL